MLRYLIIIMFSVGLFVSPTFAQQSTLPSQEDKEIQALDWEYRYCLERMKSIQAEYKALMEKRRQKSEEDRKRMAKEGQKSDTPKPEETVQYEGTLEHKQ